MRKPKCIHLKLKQQQAIKLYSCNKGNLNNLLSESGSF